METLTVVEKYWNRYWNLLELCQLLDVVVKFQLYLLALLEISTIYISMSSPHLTLRKQRSTNSATLAIACLDMLLEVALSQ